MKKEGVCGFEKDRMEMDKKDIFNYVTTPIYNAILSLTYIQ